MSVLAPPACVTMTKSQPVNSRRMWKGERHWPPGLPAYLGLHPRSLMSGRDEGAGARRTIDDAADQRLPSRRSSAPDGPRHSHPGPARPPVGVNRLHRPSLTRSPRRTAADTTGRARTSSGLISRWSYLDVSGVPSAQDEGRGQQRQSGIGAEHQRAAGRGEQIRELYDR